jgi:hypothetical protein
VTPASLLLVALFGLAPSDSVTLIRGGCMGPCPEYEVTIADTGRVRWLGLDFVDVIGETEYVASSGRARRIVRRAARFDYDAITRADRQRCTTDMRKAHVVFADPRTRRALYDDHGCSSPAHRRARRLERAIDRVANTRRFLPRGRPPCVHTYDNIHYHGPDDIAVRATAVDQPYAIHRSEVLDANLVSLRKNPTFRVEVWSMGRPSPAQQQRVDAYADALAEAGIARERIQTAMLPGSGGSKLGAIADDMVRVAITSGTCRLLRSPNRSSDQ